MMGDFELRRRAGEAEAQIVQAQAESRALEAELLSWGVRLGRQIVDILETKKGKLLPEDVEKILELALVRMIITRDPFVKSLSAVMPVLRELQGRLGQHTTMPPVSLEI